MLTPDLAIKVPGNDEDVVCCATSNLNSVKGPKDGKLANKELKKDG